MAFVLHEGPIPGPVPMRDYTANATIAKGDVVVVTAGNNFRCDPAAANASATTFTAGVAAHAANANESVLVQLPMPGTTWIADADAAAASANGGAVFTMGAAGVITNGSAANQGGRVVVLATANSQGANLGANKYVVSFNQANCRY